MIEFINGVVDLPTYGECVAIKSELTYVEQGLNRYNDEDIAPYSEIYSFNVLPIISDPTSEDGDGDGLIDIHDNKPLVTIDERFMHIDKYSFEPTINFVTEHKKNSDNCYATQSDNPELVLQSCFSLFGMSLILPAGLSPFSSLYMNGCWNGMPRASLFLYNFLENNGDTIYLKDCDVYSIITSSVRCTEHFNYNMDFLRQLCEDTLIDGDTLLFSSTGDSELKGMCYTDQSNKCNVKHTGIADCNITETARRYAIGDAYCSIVAEATRDGNLFYVKYKYIINDIYEWGWHDKGNDYYQHMLHECGMAREFLVYGKYEGVEAWKPGERNCS